MKDLIEILTWCRGANTRSEAQFVKEHIASIENAWADEFGNYHVTIGQQPRILWSCHTDTVTRKEGRQNVKWGQNGILMLNNGQQGQCLGADDGAGVWLMLELLKEKKPGHYVFHREEEVGGNGSSWIAKNAYVLPDTIQCAIAMDRAGTKDVITHQGFQRCCSDEFAKSLGAQLVEGMRPDDTGVFTDTANYVDLIGECTNLSVGYERNHGPSETLDTIFLRRLRDRLMDVDVDQLEFTRQPGEVEWGGYGGYGYGGTGGSSGYPHEAWMYDEEDYYNNNLEKKYEKDEMAYTDMVSCAPEIASRLLEECGVTRQEFRAHVFAITGRLLGE